MKQKVSPVTAVLLAVIAVAVLALVGYRVFATTSAASLPTATLKPANPDDPKYKPHLPPGVGGGAGS